MDHRLVDALLDRERQRTDDVAHLVRSKSIVVRRFLRRPELIGRSYTRMARRTSPERVEMLHC